MTTTLLCDHDDDPLTCPVPSCNPRGAGDPFDGPDGPDPSPVRTLIARHDGPCADGDCPDRIEPGDPIVWRPDDGAATHTACRAVLEVA